MEILFVLTGIFIGLIPISAILSQFIGTHRKLAAGRIVTTIMSFVICAFLLILEFLALITGNNLIVYILFSIALLLIWLVIWIQRNSDSANRWRKRINICLLLANIVLMIFMGYVAISVNSNFDSATDGHWEEQFTGKETQEDRDAYYTPSSFERDFGFTLPEFNVIEMKTSSAGFGIGGYSVTVETKTTIPDDFFLKQVSKNEMEFDSISYKDNVFYGYKDQGEFRITKTGKKLTIEVVHHG